MSSRRSKLFSYLRVFFFLDFFLLVAVFSFWLYVRHSRSSLIELVEKQFAHNLALSAELYNAYYFITNRYISASASFASNVLGVAVASIPPSRVSSSALNSSQLPGSISTPPDLPPIQFNGYYEVNSVPFIRVRGKHYKVGDILLGYPVEGISPDVVEYRGKYWKVDQDLETKK